MELYFLLKELGGRATTGELRRLVIERYGESSTNTQVTHYLKRAQKWDVVNRDKQGYWYISDGDEEWDKLYKAQQSKKE